jgi:hypothetical protein
MVIPAQAGIHSENSRKYALYRLDSGLRGNELRSTINNPQSTIVNQQLFADLGI